MTISNESLGYADGQISSLRDVVKEYAVKLDAVYDDHKCLWFKKVRDPHNVVVDYEPLDISDADVQGLLNNWNYYKGLRDMRRYLLGCF